MKIKALTGEVAASFLAKMNVKYVIVGHSERREIFGETDDMVQRKIATCQKYAMTPILCVGETLAEREAGGTDERFLDKFARRCTSAVPNRWQQW